MQGCRSAQLRKGSSPRDWTITKLYKNALELSHLLSNWLFLSTLAVTMHSFFALHFSLWIFTNKKNIRQSSYVSGFLHEHRILAISRVTNLGGGSKIDSFRVVVNWHFIGDRRKLWLKSWFLQMFWVVSLDLTSGDPKTRKGSRSASFDL